MNTRFPSFAKRAVLAASVAASLVFWLAPTSSYAQSDAAAVAPSEPLPSNDLTPSILYQVLAAEIAAQRGQAGIAASTYLGLARSTRDPRFARRATELALSERNLESAIASAQIWRELSPTNDIANNTLEALYLNSGRFSLAEPMLRKRLESARKQQTTSNQSNNSNPRGTPIRDGIEVGPLPDAYRSIERTLSRAQDRKAALALFEKLSQPELQTLTVRNALSNLATAAGLPERAAAEAIAAHKLSPDNEPLLINTVLLNHQISSKKGDNQVVYDLIKPFLERNPSAKEARIVYGRLLTIDGKNDEAQAQLERVLKEDANNPGVLYALAQSAYQTKRLPEAKAFLERFIALPRNITRDDNSAYVFLAQIAEDSNDLNLAINWLSKVQRGDNYLPSVSRRAHLLGKQGKLDEARALLLEVSPVNGRERQLLISAEASVLRQANKFDEAFQVLDKALAETPNNPELLYDQAMAAEKLNNLPVMEKSLRRLIEIDPDRAEAYNALGYTLADRNMRLPEALVLIEKALQLAPNNAHILDSMGWVLFRLKRNDEALSYLERAYKIAQEPDIAIHLGEVYWQMGKRTEALNFWRDARQREPNNETLKETLQRLNANL